MARQRVVLVDGSSLIYRAFFAIPNTFATSDGLPTNATYGFATMFRKVLGGKRPSHGAVIFDAPGKTFRDERFPEYKAQRPKMARELRAQLASIDRVVGAHAFPLLRVPGYEADDVIATLTRQAVDAGFEVHIISGDKDFAQLIGEHVRMVDTMRDVSYDAELVRKKWGVLPDRFVDYLALLGDKVDNVPGVPGVGQKTAVALLERFGSLDAVLAGTDQLKGKRKENLETFADQARLSRDLVTLDAHAELPMTFEELELKEPDPAVVEAVFRELEFYSLLPDDEGPAVEQLDVALLTDAAALDAFLAERPFAVHVVWEGESAMRGALRGVALGHEEGLAFVPVDPAGDLESDLMSRLRAHLAGEQDKAVHGMRDQRCALLRHGLDLEGVKHDTQLASFLVDPTGNIPHELGRVSRAFLHEALAPRKVLVGTGKKQTPLAQIPDAEVAAWAGQQVRAVWELWHELAPLLEELDQTRILEDLSQPLSDVLTGMQMVGIRVDRAVLDEMGVEFGERKAEIEQQIYAHAGREFNVASTKQLGEVLFDEMGLPILKRTKTGYSTAADVLERLRPKHEIAGLILRQRALAKLINTYTRVLSESVHEDTGRIHCTFQQTTGASGRLITTDPDLQRTPIRTEDGKRIREAFVPREGWEMVSADWSQIELRLLAHVSEDPALGAAFSERVDVHKKTAAGLFDCAPEGVTPEQRNVGKTVNFATIYGQGATALGQALGISRGEAKRYIERYFEVYSGVRSWLDRTIADAHVEGAVYTMLGRRRLVPELSSNAFAERAYGERIAANTPIQGSAADLCKLAMLGIAERMREAGLEARMLLQIHDELVFETPPEEREVLMALVRDEMENVWPELRVPLVVDMGYGGSWGEAH